MDRLDDRYVGDAYVEHNEDWHEGRASWKAAQVSGLLRRNAISPRSICDIGCGTGGVLDELRSELGSEVELVGYEVSPRALELASSVRRTRVELVNGSHDVDDRTFDLLLCLDVFEHVEDYYGFLRDIQSKAPLAVFHIPIDTAVTSVLRPEPILKSSVEVGHIHHFTRTTALEALRHSGYRIIDWCHTVPAVDHVPQGSRQRIGRRARLLASSLSVDLASKWLTGFPLLVLAECLNFAPAGVGTKDGST